MNAPMKQRSLVRRMFRAFARLALLGVLGIAALFVSLWFEHKIALTLPTPTGPFAVGRAIYDWTDDSALDFLAPTAGAKRELLVWIWFPAATGQSSATDDYFPAQLRTTIERQSGVLLSRFLTRDRAKVQARSLRDAGVSPQQPSYPVIVFRAGASLEVANYSSLAEDLASHGYVVVGIDAPYRTSVVVFPDGREMERLPQNNPELCLERTGQERVHCVDKLMTAWTSDISFVLDRLAQRNISDPSGKFAGRLDMTRVGLLGHSFGGAQAAQFCSQDSRCKAGIDLDGALQGNVIQAGIHKPFLFLLGDHTHESDPEAGEIMANIHSVYDRLPVDGRFLVVIRGANHFMFSDDGALLKSHLLLGALRAVGVLGLDGRRQLAITSYCLHAFFDAYLKGASSAPLKLSSPLYPEIQVLH